MRNRKENDALVPLSEQQLIDCDKSNFGCSGGWPYNAVDWLSKNGGLMTFADYPLRTNYSGPCQFDDKKETIKVKGYLNVSRDEAIIKDALYETGPLSILLDFTGMFHYKSGIASPLMCSDWPDHALVLVGYGHDPKKKDEEYWLIKNSWGPKWGENGYLRLKRGAQKCGIQKWAVTAVFDK
jgi:C1A family cysteine protease